MTKNQLLKQLNDALLNSDNELVRLTLADNPSLAKTKDEDQRIPLHWAASSGQEEAVRLLLALGSDVNAVDEDGWTPLIIAVSAGHRSIVDILLNAGLMSMLKRSQEIQHCMRLIIKQSK
ncbi:ankyrin repeat-containing domain protein [Syncephalis fuscata]|nr:ankyrin repeat-containing domain protein [Syncephalis fuscata]